MDSQLRTECRSALLQVTFTNPLTELEDSPQAPRALPRVPSLPMSNWREILPDELQPRVNADGKFLINENATLRANCCRLLPIYPTYLWIRYFDPERTGLPRALRTFL